MYKSPWFPPRNASFFKAAIHPPINPPPHLCCSSACLGRESVGKLEGISCKKLDDRFLIRFRKINDQKKVSNCVVAVIFPILDVVTLPETNIAPKNEWLEDEFPFGKAYFQGWAASFRGYVSHQAIRYLIWRYAYPIRAVFPKFSCWVATVFGALP